MSDGDGLRFILDDIGTEVLIRSSTEFGELASLPSFPFQLRVQGKFLAEVRLTDEFWSALAGENKEYLEALWLANEWKLDGYEW